MRSLWISRSFFAVAAGAAVAVAMSGTACTRWGKPGPVPPTIAPLASIYVDPSTGSDSTGTGSDAKPYKTFTKAVAVLAVAKVLSSSGVTIFLSNGSYVAANGEKFPIVIPRTVTISGENFSGGVGRGTFIDGIGEDTLFEQLLHAPVHSQYATLEVPPNVSVSLSDVYVGASKIKLPSSKAAYASLDVLGGTMNAGTAAFGAGIVSALPNVSGVIVPGGSLSCNSCQIRGNYFAIGALSVPMATSSPSSTSAPGTANVTLMRSTGISTLEAKVADILTDGTANVTASSQTFEQAQYAFTDALRPLQNTSARGTVDFGGGAANSSGGNIFIGARSTEIFLIRRFENLSAYSNTWNPGQQGANGAGQYTHKIVFGPGAFGKNVTIRKDASGSTVTVGPAVLPTPTPSSSPSTSPSPTPTP